MITQSEQTLESDPSQRCAIYTCDELEEAKEFKKRTHVEDVCVIGGKSPLTCVALVWSVSEGG